ncbi:MAG: PQQ-binding-like beta-propeller repeat protein, partial [Actinomycetota bacterium]|nr:PQQ-binding-like beta-propeller repeat protein [Actinomycetota bacterium]
PPPVQQPPEERPPPQGTPVGGAEGDVVSYFGNPQHTQATATEAVFGPLAVQWSKRFATENTDGGFTNQPLLVGGKVLVNVSREDDRYGSQVVALDAWTGRELWRRPTPGTYFTAPLAADAGRVYSINDEGVARAFSIEDGRPLWSQDVNADVDAPVAAGGTVYFGNTAVDGATGNVLWRANEEPVQSAVPMIDSERVYMTDECGSAVALSRSDGKVVWRRNRYAGTTCHRGSARGYPGMLYGGRVFAPGGFTYDAATGEDRPASPVPEAAAGDLGFGRGPFAFSLAGGETRWGSDKRGAFGTTLGLVSRVPLVVAHDVYAVAEGRGLLAFDRETGEPRGYGVLRQAGFNEPGGLHPGMSAGSPGVLVASGGQRLTAFRSLLRPDPGGIDAAVTVNDVLVGNEGEVAGAAGRTFRESRPILEVEADPYPYGRFRPAGRSGPVNADGTTFFHPRPTRNTRYRMRAQGVPGTTRAVTVYAYPRAGVKSRFVSGRHVRMTVRLRGGRDFRVGSRRFVLYLGRPYKRRYYRLGTARIRQAGRSSAVARVTFTFPREFSDLDVFAWCVPGLRAWGRRDALSRRCGARVVKAPFPEP